jgi:hypothetical protein
MSLASLAAASRNCLHLDGKGHGSCGNPAHLQITGMGSMAACVRITQDTIRGSQDFANILAHGHDGVSEVFLRLNTQNLRIEAGSWQVRGLRRDVQIRYGVTMHLSQNVPHRFALIITKRLGGNGFHSRLPRCCHARRFRKVDACVRSL